MDLSDAFGITLIDSNLRRKATKSPIFLKVPLRRAVEMWSIAADAALEHETGCSPSSSLTSLLSSPSPEQCSSGGSHSAQTTLKKKRLSLLP